MVFIRSILRDITPRTFVPFKYRPKKQEGFQFLKSIYSYPSKIEINWTYLDDLNEDTCLLKNYHVLQHGVPFIDIADDFLLFGSKNQKLEFPKEKLEFSKESFEKIKTTVKTAFAGYADDFNSRLVTSKFYSKETKPIQEALANIPVYTVVNGDGEIALAKPSRVPDNCLYTLEDFTYFFFIDVSDFYFLKRGLKYAFGEFLGGIDNPYKDIGFFFLNRQDAEDQRELMIKDDPDGAELIGLSVDCISLKTAYKITREHHTGIDFKFMPNMPDIRSFMKGNIKHPKIAVDDEQQQLRFRRRGVTRFPIGGWSRLVWPEQSFVHRNEYYKGLPIYVVQLRDTRRNLVLEVFHRLAGVADSWHGGFMQLGDSMSGCGHNWMIQGSIEDGGKTERFTNYVFFDRQQAFKFANRNGLKTARYSGGRYAPTGVLVRKPKIYASNFEDFIERWEETLAEKLAGKNPKTIFTTKDTIFVPSKNMLNLKTFEGESKDLLKTKIKQNLKTRYSRIKNVGGWFFSMVDE